MVIKYVSSDGKEFTNQLDCEVHEQCYTAFKNPSEAPHSGTLPDGSHAYLIKNPANLMSVLLQSLSQEEKSAISNEELTSMIESFISKYNSIETAFRQNHPDEPIIMIQTPNGFKRRDQLIDEAQTQIEQSNKTIRDATEKLDVLEQITEEWFDQDGDVNETDEVVSNE